MCRPLLHLFSAFLLLHPTLSLTRHPLILILIDGFRWDYTTVHRGEDALRGFEEITREGTKAAHLNPVFPTNSFPNWHTIVTGLYPESHGIISNYMTDLERKAKFNIFDPASSSDPAWWSNGEPIWTTATKANLKTAMFQWARCDVKWDNTLPNFCEPFTYDAKGYIGNFAKRLSQALSMIQHENYDLVMMYEGAVDTLGHKYGPVSTQVSNAVKDVDTALHTLWREMEARGMTNSTNVVIVSDHGMMDVQPGKVEEVDVGGCLAGLEVDSVVEQGGYVNISPAPGHTQKVVEAIRECAGVGGRIDIYTKEEIPQRYHYRKHRLIHKLLLIAKPGYSITVGEWENKDYRGLKGNHGYDDSLGYVPDMRGILYARGPVFAKGVETKAVDQVDVYGLLCHALALPSRPHNGTFAHVAPFFDTHHTHHHQQPQISNLTFTLILLFVSALILVSGKALKSLPLK